MMTESDNWIIRRAGREDAAALAVSIDAAYEGYAARLADLPAVSDGIVDDIRDNIVWVATLNGKVVGGLVLVRKPDHMVLANVAVAPDAAGRGLGKALIERAEAECRKHGVGELRLTTHSGMPENVAMYGHLGWRETGRSGNKVHMAKVVAV